MNAFWAGLTALSLAACSTATGKAVAQSEGSYEDRFSDRVTVETSDIDRFWTTYDRVAALTDRADRIRILQDDYIDGGTRGVRLLMAARNYTAGEFIDAFDAWPAFWTSIRPATARAEQASATLNEDLERLTALYPPLKMPAVTYAIGLLRTGGTIVDDHVLIGAEVALAGRDVDLSEMPTEMQARLGPFFATEPWRNNAQNNVHEIVHTAQEAPADTVAARVLYEGAADFVAEKVTGRTAPIDAYKIGPGQLDRLRTAFRRDLDSGNLNPWLYNGPDNEFGVADIGYFVGYRVASRLFAAAPDERSGIADLIELDYGDHDAVVAAIKRSAFLEEGRP
ncbi:MAG: hypothetical protein WA906_05860 [Pacificimonas sp.]